jgi:hypothetical protein
MNLISDTLVSYLPVKRKQTPSGWISFNAVCCDDKRNRGGLIKDGDTVSYHCFNCGFKTSWQPGRSVGVKLRKLFRLLNVPDDIISKITIESLRYNGTETSTPLISFPKFQDRSLPTQAIPIIDYINDTPEELIPVLEYLQSRGLYLEDYPFYWTDKEGFAKRLIIPFFYYGRIVGYTARLTSGVGPKYMAEQQPGYVFNLDAQNSNREFVIVCEGPMDAICIGGVAIMGSEANTQQRMLIDQLKRTVIVVPDRDNAGMKLVDEAIKYNWSVSFPDWDEGIKDINDAVRAYGKLTTLLMIKQQQMSNEVKIKLTAKEWFKC